MEVKWEALMHVQVSNRQGNMMKVEEVPNLNPNSYLGKAYITLILF
jgi:hypothetical protein